MWCPSFLCCPSSKADIFFCLLSFTLSLFFHSSLLYPLLHPLSLLALVPVVFEYQCFIFHSGIYTLYLPISRGIVLVTIKRGVLPPGVLLNTPSALEQVITIRDMTPNGKKISRLRNSVQEMIHSNVFFILQNYLEMFLRPGTLCKC